MRTDHSVLISLLSFKNLKRQTARWVQRLQEKYFTSQYRQGRKHTNADAICRRPCPEELRRCRLLEPCRPNEGAAGRRGADTVAAIAFGR
jgi:hypothetical protein